MRVRSFAGETSDAKSLKEEYKSGSVFGILRLGEDHLFFKKRLSVYSVSYSYIQRYFRRVHIVKAGDKSINVESLVIVADNKEIAELQLPGAKAVPKIMAVLKEKMPDVPSEYVKEESAIG